MADFEVVTARVVFADWQFDILKREVEVAQQTAESFSGMLAELHEGNAQYGGEDYAHRRDIEMAPVVANYARHHGTVFNLEGTISPVFATIESDSPTLEEADSDLWLSGLNIRTRRTLIRGYDRPNETDDDIDRTGIGFIIDPSLLEQETQVYIATHEGVNLQEILLPRLVHLAISS